MGFADPLRIDVRDAPDRVVISLDGELDLANAPQLQRAIDDADLGDGKMLVLDLQKLAFIDSTGLRTLLSVRDSCRQAGGQFAVTPSSEQVQRFLVVTHAIDHMHVIAGPDEPRP